MLTNWPLLQTTRTTAPVDSLKLALVRTPDAGGVIGHRDCRGSRRRRRARAGLQAERIGQAVRAGDRIATGGAVLDGALQRRVRKVDRRYSGQRAGGVERQVDVELSGGVRRLA